ncbi:DUF2283 domain-containing protein, partial [Frankia sp. CpI1-P]
MLVTWDQTANAIYLAMGETAQSASRTVQLDSGTLVDVDGFDVVVGIEIINPYRALPTSDIMAMHIPATDRSALERYLRGLSGQSAEISSTPGGSPPSLIQREG